MKFLYTNPRDINLGDIVINIQQSKIWIILNKQPTKHENLHMFSYMSFDGKVKVDIFGQEIKVLNNGNS
jgi:hypothetical protein